MARKKCRSCFALTFRWFRDIIQKCLPTAGSDNVTPEQLLDDDLFTCDEKQKVSCPQHAECLAAPEDEPLIGSCHQPEETSRAPSPRAALTDSRGTIDDVSTSVAAASTSTDDIMNLSSTLYQVSAATQKFPQLIAGRSAVVLSPCEENRQLKMQLTCKVCAGSLVGIAFLPCQHLVCCASCGSATTTCVICNVGIKGTVRVTL